MKLIPHSMFYLVAVLALLPAMAWSASPASDSPPTDRLIIKWRDAKPTTEIEPARVHQLATRTGRVLTRGNTIGGGMSVIHLDRSRTGAELQTLLSALRADPDVELVEPDRRVKAQAYIPSDPLYATSQWYLKSAQLAAIRADDAWDVSRGGASAATSPVVVAVIDTGVRFDHPDLGGKLLPGYDFVSADAGGQFAVANDGDGWDADPSDPGDFLTATELASDTFKDGKCGGGTDHDMPTKSSWHGTRVSGLIAANTDNAQGMAGTGFNIRVLPVRALGKCGGFESDVLAGMYWAAGLVLPPPLLQRTDLPMNPNPAQIINMSLGSEGACSATYATAVRDVTKHGVLIVASAGNEGAAVGTPASCAGVLAVAGIRHAGTKVGYSNLGLEVSIAAPAGNCFNTAPGSACLYSLDTTTNDGTSTPGSSIYTDQILRPNYGTSFASPLAAGTAGLMKATNPALTPAMLIARIKASARSFPTVSDTTPQPPACQLPTVAPLQDRECICNTQVCGAGMLNTAGAVNEALRPAVLADVVGTIGAGRMLTLDGSQSGVAAGRMVASYAWTVVSMSDGAGTPVIQSADLPQASVQSPGVGSIVLRLTVTDNLGSTDFADVTITAALNGGSSTSTSPPPATGNGSGGGGRLSLALLLLGVLMLYRTAMQRRGRLASF